jgi:predicted phage terminase large subunit-like protein
MKVALGSRTFQALHQQTPTSASGNIVKRSWFKFYKTRPEHWDLYSTTWDCTFKEDKDNDFVVGQAWCKLESKFYLLDQVRGRMGFMETVTTMMQFCAKHPEAMEHIVEKKANGEAIIDTLASKILGIVGFVPTDSKVSRFNSVSPLIEAGNILLPDPDYFDVPWVHEYIDEWAALPRSKYDDQADATTQFLLRAKDTAYAWLSAVENQNAEQNINSQVNSIFGWNVTEGRGQDIKSLFWGKN